MKRRDFIKSATGASVLLAGATASADEVPFFAKKGIPCLQVFTDEETAQFRLLVDGRINLSFEARAHSGALVPLQVLSRTGNPFGSHQVMAHLLASNLSPGVDYSLIVRNSSTGEVVDERTFSALDSSRSNKLKFALISCMFDKYQLNGGIWDKLEDSRPDLIFFIGDSCYTDFQVDGSVADHWRRHFETRNALKIFRWKRLVPVMSTWDDHDFGGNNSNKTNDRKDAFRVAFNTMLGSAKRPALEYGPGVSSAVTLFGQRFFLMDDRYFRDPVGTQNGSHWGGQQEEWLFDLASRGSEPIWLLNGNQFFGGYLKVESFESDHPAQFSRVLRNLGRLEAPVVFGSGDIHFSELMAIEAAQLGYRTYEVTSSSMHSTTYPGMQNRAKNKRRLEATWHHNFILVESEALAGGKISFTATCICYWKTLFSKKFVVDRANN